MCWRQAEVPCRSRGIGIRWIVVAHKQIRQYRPRTTCLGQLLCVYRPYIGQLLCSQERQDTHTGSALKFLAADPCQ